MKKKALDAPCYDLCDRLLTTQEASVWLGCSKSTVTKLARRGRLQAIRINHLRRFRMADLKAFVEQNLESPRPTRKKKKRGKR